MKKGLAVFMIIVLTGALVCGNSLGAVMVPLSEWSLDDECILSFGEGNMMKYSLEGMVQRYKSSNPEYKRLELNSHLNELYLAQLGLQLDALEESITKYKQLIEGNKTLAEIYQKEMNLALEGSPEYDAAKKNRDTCLLNTAAYESNLSSTVVQKAETYSQREVYRFASVNGDILKRQEETKQISAFKEKCLTLLLLRENEYVYDCSVDYHSILLQFQRISFSKGRVAQADVDMQDALLGVAQSERDSVMAAYNSTFKEVLRKTGLSETQNAELTLNLKNMREQTLLSFKLIEGSLKANDLKEKQLMNNLRIIDGRIDILNDIFMPDNQLIAIESKKKEIAEVELEQWLIERLAKLNNLYSAYEKRYIEVNSKEKLAEAQYKRYLTMLNKFNLGLISKPDMLKERLEFSKAGIEAYTAFKMFVDIRNAIDLAMLGVII